MPYKAMYLNTPNEVTKAARPSLFECEKKHSYVYKIKLKLGSMAIDICTLTLSVAEHS